MSLAEQWAHWRARFRKRYKARIFLAYLQSFSNTHGTHSEVAETIEQLEHLEGLAGLCLGTRPDCLDKDKLALIAGFPAEERWLELGLQSSSDATLRRINRGHTMADFVAAVEDAQAVGGMRVCVHVVAGLPGETMEDFLETVRAVAALPVHGVKFHNLYVCKGSPLETVWRRGGYEPVNRDAYVDTVCRAIGMLPPGMVVQRLTGDAAPGELLAPEWAREKRSLLREIENTLETQDILQGCWYEGPVKRAP